MNVIPLFNKLLALTALLIVSVLLSGKANAQDLHVEFVASDISWTNSEYTGHAFMCIIVTTNTGPKEACYGFYPKEGSKAFIGGPGEVQSEFKKNPTRFSRIVKSIRKRITDDQRRGILRLVNEWNTKPYNLTDQDCIEFVASVAKEIGWDVPLREPTDLPATYLEKLKSANELKPSLQGTWLGTMTLGNRTFPLSIVFKLTDGQLSGTYSVPNTVSQGAVNNLQIRLDRSASFSCFDSPNEINFTGTLAVDIKSMSGTFSSRPGNGTWILRKQ
jgi:hypothetical protein